MEGYRPGDECTLCKGKCCKEKGCSLSPEDMRRAIEKYEDMMQREDAMKEKDASQKEDMKNRILALLKAPEGQFAIDYFSTEKGPLFYLRMRHKCYTFIGVDAMGECVALTEEGCTLSEEARPKGGRFLKSAPDRKCVQYYTREMMQADWAPYCEVLKDIWKEYDAKFKADGTYDRCDADYFAWMRMQREGK